MDIHFVLLKFCEVGYQILILFRFQIHRMRLKHEQDLHMQRLRYEQDHLSLQQEKIHDVHGFAIR